MQKVAAESEAHGQRGVTPRGRGARVGRRTWRRALRRVGWSIVAALVVMATASCLVRLMWYQSVSHPAGETQTSVIVSKGSIEIWHANFATNASQTIVRRSILNRQFEPGFDPEIGVQFRGNITTLKIPFTAIVLGMVAGLGVALIWRRSMARALQRGKCACGYSLAGLGARGKCPECGAAFGDQATSRA